MIGVIGYEGSETEARLAQNLRNALFECLIEVEELILFYSFRSRRWRLSRQLDGVLLDL